MPPFMLRLRACPPATIRLSTNSECCALPSSVASYSDCFRKQTHSWLRIGRRRCAFRHFREPKCFQQPPHLHAGGEMGHGGAKTGNKLDRIKHGGAGREQFAVNYALGKAWRDAKS